MSPEPQHQLRARFCGVLQWLCPWCGHFNRDRMNYQSWRVRCRGERCRRWFAHGHVFHSLQGERFSGRKESSPPDIVLPTSRMELSYRYGQPVNRLEVPDESKVGAEVEAAQR